MQVSDKDVQLFTYKQLQNIYSYVGEIIDTLPPKALDELLSGYENDVEKLIDEITRQTNLVINHNANKLNSESLGYLKELEYSMDQQLKKYSLNYFKATVLTNFEMGWRNLEWGNMIQLYPWSAYLAQRGSGKSFDFCFATPLWRLYSYDPPQFLTKDTRDNRNRKETALITNESRLGILHINKITEEIRNNPILKDKLNSKNSSLGKESITTDTGSILHLRSFGSMIRGLHVGYAGTDDFLNKSALYSKDQRDKFKEVFYAEIKNIVEPGGYNIVSGTPFHELDLYGDLKKDPMFRVFEYPGIFPNGTLLAPDRFTFKYLMDMKKSLGSVVFAREILVTPVSDGSSLFPWEFLNKSLIGMENIRLVNNIESFPIKLKRVVIGCDFAKSASIGADYTVYTVWGVDSNNIYYLLHIWRKRGASTNEQVNKIVELNHAFRPNKIVCESNGFQSMIAEMARKRGLNNVEDFKTTASNKKSDYEGLPSLSAFFERGEIKVPGSQEEETQNAIMQLLGEFNSIGYNEDRGTLESLGQHDDGVMSSFIALYYLIENKVNANIYFV